mmetsp:Transcript_28922/g.59132  ORF Transcript_28922/g.59132 Transcript_28922/m.59132 type:complete len:239 (-) Transcript_28922:1492-2208(-)
MGGSSPISRSSSSTAASSGGTCMPGNRFRYSRPNRPYFFFSFLSAAPSSSSPSSPLSLEWESSSSSAASFFRCVPLLPPSPLPPSSPLPATDASARTLSSVHPNISASASNRRLNARAFASSACSASISSIGCSRSFPPLWLWLFPSKSLGSGSGTNAGTPVSTQPPVLLKKSYAHSKCMGSIGSCSCCFLTHRRASPRRLLSSRLWRFRSHTSSSVSQAFSTTMVMEVRMGRESRLS